MDDGCNIAGLRMQLQLLRKLGRLMPGMLKLQCCLKMLGWCQELVRVAMISSNLRGSPKLALHMVKVSGLTLPTLFFTAIGQLVGLSLGCGSDPLRTATKPYASNPLTRKRFFGGLPQTAR